MMMKFHYIQSSLADVDTSRTRKRFDELTTELATIGATVQWPIVMTHDDARIEIDCPQGRETEATAILNKHFPSR
jgi:hypothetical protein